MYLSEVTVLNINDITISTHIFLALLPQWGQLLIHWTMTICPAAFPAFLTASSLSSHFYVRWFSLYSIPVHCGPKPWIWVTRVHFPISLATALIVSFLFLLHFFSPFILDTEWFMVSCDAMPTVALSLCSPIQGCFPRLTLTEQCTDLPWALWFPLCVVCLLACSVASVVPDSLSHALDCMWSPNVTSSWGQWPVRKGLMSPVSLWRECSYWFPTHFTFPICFR